MEIKKKATKIVEILKNNYPATCSLIAEKDYELLFATRLSAQCTDARVNTVTKELYSKYKTLESLANAELDDICKIVMPCGLFRTKARDIKLGAQYIINEYGGKVPGTMDELLKIPGVGRKTANLILSDIFGHPAIVADTHCIRISNRLGLISPKTDDPFKVELTLCEIIEPCEQAPLCHRFVHFGRDICKARAPECNRCPLAELCNFKGLKD